MVETQTERVVLNLPKNIMALLRASTANVNDYLQRTISEGVQADLDNNQVFTESLREKYKLN
jgi:hypothetical protein